MIFLPKWVIFRFHLNFQGCNIHIRRKTFEIVGLQNHRDFFRHLPNPSPDEEPPRITGSRGRTKAKGFGPSCWGLPVKGWVTGLTGDLRMVIKRSKLGADAADEMCFQFRFALNFPGSLHEPIWSHFGPREHGEWCSALLDVVCWKGFVGWCV